jgi:phage terminase large subunit
VPDNIRLLRNHGWEYAYGIDKPKGSVMAGISLLQSTNVFYTDCSSGIEHEHQTYQYRADRMGVVDDEVLKENDDLIDPIRYLRRHYEKN